MVQVPMLKIVNARVDDRQHGGLIKTSLISSLRLLTINNITTYQNIYAALNWTLKLYHKIEIRLTYTFILSHLDLEQFSKITNSQRRDGRLLLNLN